MFMLEALHAWFMGLDGQAVLAMTSRSGEQAVGWGCQGCEAAVVGPKEGHPWMVRSLPSCSWKALSLGGWCGLCAGF